MKISTICEGYFNSITAMRNWNDNNRKTNAVALLSVLSYMTVIIPLGFAAAYAASSLYGRVSKAKNLDSQVETTKLGGDVFFPVEAGGGGKKRTSSSDETLQDTPANSGRGNLHLSGEEDETGERTPSSEETTQTTSAKPGKSITLPAGDVGRERRSFSGKATQGISTSSGRGSFRLEGRGEMTGGFKPKDSIDQAMINLMQFFNTLPKFKLSDIESAYNGHYFPQQNLDNLLEYNDSADYQRHAQTARIYYNSDQLAPAEALAVIYQREPTNITMGKDQYNKEELYRLFGYRDGIYNTKGIQKTDGSLFKDLPNTAAVYSETFLWPPPGQDQKKEIACLSLPAPALDTLLQPHYNYYMGHGSLDEEKYRKEMEFLFNIIKQAIVDNKDTAFNGEGINRVVLSKIGQGAFLGALGTEDKGKARKAFTDEVKKLLRWAEEEGIHVVISDYREVEGGDKTFKDVTIYGDILETAKEHDLIINAWDPHSAPGNGNDNDGSFDGAMGRGTGILLTQGWPNEHLRNPDNLVPVAGYR